MKRRLVRYFFCCVSLLAVQPALSADGRQLKEMAEGMLRVSDECLYDVRDRSTSYARSRNCKRLDGMAMAYIQAGGGRDDKTEHMRIFTLVRMQAWMALALSNGMYRNESPELSIW